MMISFFKKFIVFNFFELDRKVILFSSDDKVDVEEVKVIKKLKFQKC